MTDMISTTSTLPPPRRTVARAWPWLLGAALVVAAGAWWGTRPGATEKPPDSAPAPADAITLSSDALRDAGIVVEAARLVSRAERLDASAVLGLDERNTSRIGSIVDGIVVATHAHVGDRVRAGTLLAVIHSKIVHDSWASYRKAVADRRRQTTELTYAKQAEGRAERLFTDKAISMQELERARADRVAAEEVLEMAVSEVRRAENDLEHLGISSRDDPGGESAEQIPVRTPITGVVLERLVTPGTAVTTGMPLFVVSDLSRLWAVAEIDEGRLSVLAVGRPAELRVPAYPGAVFPASITFIGDTVNPTTRRVTVRCEVTNATGRLKPQMFAAVGLGAGEPRQVLVVPSASVQEMGDEHVVFVQDREGRFHRREIDVGAEQDGLVEVRRGLEAGERVASGGTFLLKSQLLKPAETEN